MAACDIKIELDDENKVRMGGELVSGTVIVQCHNNTNCKTLDVSTGWATHGRGNIDTGDGEKVSVYSGVWSAGQEYRYPFQLKSLEWPPTYYGNLMNVSHSVRARANIAWAVDPKAEKEFPVAATASPSNSQPPQVQAQGANLVIGWIVVAVVLSVFAVFLFWIVPIIILIGGIIWFFKSYLPKQLTGPVFADVQPRRAATETALKCHLEFSPRRNVSINAVRYKASCIEKCVSGSGSNQKTHRHILVSSEGELASAQVLPAGQNQCFDFDFEIPANAPPSIKLSNNEVLWSIEMRVDIPRWPDWQQSFDIIVEPSSNSAALPQSVADNPLEDSWLNEVLTQLEHSQDHQRLEMVLQAIREHQFELQLDVEGEMNEPRSAPAGEHGRWFHAYLDQRDWPVALFIPTGQTLPTQQARWKGPVSIIDFDPDVEQLVVKAVHL